MTTTFDSHWLDRDATVPLTWEAFQVTLDEVERLRSLASELSLAIGGPSDPGQSKTTAANAVCYAIQAGYALQALGDGK